MNTTEVMLNRAINSLNQILKLEFKIESKVERKRRYYRIYQESEAQRNYPYGDLQWDMCCKLYQQICFAIRTLYLAREKQKGESNDRS